MAKEKEKEPKEKSEKVQDRLIAKKPFRIVQNDYDSGDIKIGDDLSSVPEKYHENLRTEGVL